MDIYDLEYFNEYMLKYTINYQKNDISNEQKLLKIKLIYGSLVKAYYLFREKMEIWIKIVWISMFYLL